MGRTLLITVELASGSIWLGGLVALAIVSSAAGRVLDPPARVALFRGIGRLYGIVGTGALVVAVIGGVGLAGSPSGWSPAITATFTLSIALLLVTALGMAQARRMTAVRRRAIGAPDDENATEAVRRGAVLARALRGTIGVVSLVITVLVAHLLAL